MGGLSAKYATADSKLAGEKRDDDADGDPLIPLLELLADVTTDNGAFPPCKCSGPALTIRPLFGSVRRGSTAEYGGGASSESITDV